MRMKRSRATARKHAPATAMTETDVTALLPAARDGDPDALERVMQTMYQALHQLARRHLEREYGERTLSATELVNESFLRMFAGGRVPDLEHRRHLLALATRAMRQVLVDAGRRRKAGKRLAEEERLSLTEITACFAEEPDPLGLIRALEELEAIDPRQAAIVGLRFFAGLTEPQIAAVMGISERTVQREWRMARAWLRRALGEHGEQAAPGPRAL